MSDNNTEKKVPTRPLPKLTEMDTAPFWQGGPARVSLPAVRELRTIVWHPRAHCTGCVDGDLAVEGLRRSGDDLLL